MPIAPVERTAGTVIARDRPEDARAFPLPVLVPVPVVLLAVEPRRVTVPVDSWSLAAAGELLVVGLASLALALASALAEAPEVDDGADAEVADDGGTTGGSLADDEEDADCVCCVPVPAEPATGEAAKPLTWREATSGTATLEGAGGERIGSASVVPLALTLAPLTFFTACACLWCCCWCDTCRGLGSSGDASGPICPPLPLACLPAPLPLPLPPPCPPCAWGVKAALAAASWDIRRVLRLTIPASAASRSQGASIHSMAG